jgi:hypothetical protein
MTAITDPPLNFCEALTHVNTIILDISHRYDLIETSCVNSEIQVFNRKLRKVTKLYKHVKVLEVSRNRNVFTRHGLHLNGEGKRLMARQIVREIRQITVEEINSMVSLDQKGKIGRNFANSRCDKLEAQGNYLPTSSRTDGEQRDTGVRRFSTRIRKSPVNRSVI